MTEDGGRLARAIERAGETFARWRPSGDPTGSRDLVVRAGLVAIVALLTLALFPPSRVRDVPVVRSGTVAAEDVIAPVDFAVPRAQEDLERRREQAALTVPPVFSVVSSAADSALARFEAYLDRVAEAEVGPEAEAERLEPLNRVDGRGLGLRTTELRALGDPAVRRRLLAFAGEVFPDVYVGAWLVNAEAMANIASAQIAVQHPGGEEILVPRSEVIALRPGAEIPTLERRAPELEPDLRRLALQLLPGLLSPNLRPRAGLTVVRRAEARAEVDPIESEVLEGELIVGAHTRVTPQQERRVAALRSELERRRSGFSPEDLRVALGRLLLSASILLLFGFYLFTYRRDVFDDFRALTVVVVVWSLIVALGAFVDGVDAIPPFAAPIALASVLVAVLWDTRLSVAVTLFLVVYLASQGDLGFPLLWVGLFGGLAGGWSVRRIRRRTDFYESLLFIGVGHAVALGALALLRLWSWTDFGVAVGWGFLSAAVAVFIAMGLMPVLEWASGRTTDLTLLELADLNRPLLKRLLLEAPGTYHHSILVGNLAEAAAERIGANSLMARVGAYYHDIGKMERPEYFVENQRSGANPHNALTPRASARIVRRHVEDGVELANAAGLPEVVLDFIREHHGTTRLDYFWREEAERGRIEGRPSREFVYPGPSPRTKETAVVMLADSVEAASRVLHEPTPERFRETIRRIVETKLEQRQLDQADLTFRDLAALEDAFVSVLGGIHHHRIEYPTLALRSEEGEDAPEGPVSRIGRPSA
ncbi:MAG: HDIG domain-containing protein [Gemmatimonadetes bacterium]|nr:HDIG domain-containing protein [Gemmatimonadota bacterium]